MSILPDLMTEAEKQENREKFIAYCHEYIKRDGLERLLTYLDSKDFFDAPSSSNFHLNEPGGLCKHSINVFECALRIYLHIVKPAIQDGLSPFQEEVPLESVAISALFHDICKVELYQETERWRKDDKGKWQSYRGYVIEDDFPFGHGEKSCMRLSWYMKLTRDEMLAVRWHMGMYDIGEQGSSARYSMYAAADKSPLVSIIQAADMLAAHCLEKTTEP